MDALVSFLLRMPALILAVTSHEFAHGWVADKLGDRTARLHGRLTLNPLAHIDWFWTVLFPSLLLLSGSPVVFGMAKSVPVDPSQFRGDRRKGDLYVSLAGAGANFSVALIAALLTRLLITFVPPKGVLDDLVVYFLTSVIQINVILGIFNLLPVPPLDGSHALAYFLPKKYLPAYYSFQRYGIIAVFIFIYFFGGIFWGIISPLIGLMRRLALG